MKPDVVVVYKGVSGIPKVVRVTWENKDRLATTEVLAMAVLQDNRPNAKDAEGNDLVPNQIMRWQSEIGKDYYVLTWNTADTHCHLGGYDTDLYWFNHDGPWKPYGAPRVYDKFPYLIGPNTIVFESIMVSEEEMELVNIIYKDHKGEMF